jgi:ABC-type polysaccharide/polyol phosphate export permease/Flp pilus assembly protein TadD
VIENLEQSTEAGLLERAITAGDLEACRVQLRDKALPDALRASLYCRLGEAFYYRGERADAVACARCAFDLEPQPPAVADFCAWLFSNCGHHQAAAAAYERMLKARPGWAAGHRHASGSYTVAGDIDRAMQHAARACELEPNSAEFALHTGCLFAAAGLHHDAIGYFSRAAELAPDDPGVWRHLSGSAWALGERQRAVDLALRAHALAPQERANAHHAAELLLRSARLDEAAELITTALAADRADATGYRLLSAAEMLRGRLEAALDAIGGALALAPAEAEYHQHQGLLLHRLARFEDAAAAFDRASALEPENPAPRRSQLTVYLDSGQLREALAAGGELIRIAPDNEEYAQAVMQVLHRRFELLEGDYSVLAERSATPSPLPRPPVGLVAATQARWRVIYALILRETRTRFGDQTLGYGWALLEPILHIMMLSLVFAVLMHGRPPIGTQFFIFYYTGIIPYHIFVHSSSAMTYAVTANGALLQLPPIGIFDVIVARGLLEFITDIVVAAILLAGFGAIGLGALPYDFAGIAAATAAVWVLGCGFGFINAVVNAFFKSWDKVWAQLVRLLYFGSGIFYVPGMMPDWIRDRLAWNPVLQGVDWFRAAFFVDYTPHWLDRSYLVAVAGAVLLAGLTLERALRRHLQEPL